MKVKYIKIAFLLITTTLLFVSCEEKLDTEFGNSKVYFSNTSALLAINDSAKLIDIAAQADTTINMIGIYRSGIVDSYEQITVSIEIDSAYLATLIATAQTTLPANMTDQMTRYKNSKALGTHFCSVPATVIIPQGERKVTVPVVISKSLIKLYENAYFSYSKSDFSNSNVIKDRMLVIPLKIKMVSPDFPVLETNLRSFLEITKSIEIIP